MTDKLIKEVSDKIFSMYRRQLSDIPLTKLLDAIEKQCLERALSCDDSNGCRASFFNLKRTTYLYRVAKYKLKRTLK